MMRTLLNGMAIGFTVIAIGDAYNGSTTHAIMSVGVGVVLLALQVCPLFDRSQR